MSTRPTSAPPVAAGQPQPNRLKLVLAAGLQEIGARPSNERRLERIERFVKETLKSSVILQRIDYGLEFQEAWLRELLEPVLRSSKLDRSNTYRQQDVLFEAKNAVKSDEEVPDDYAGPYNNIVSAVADLTSAVACITGTALNPMGVEFTALEIAKLLTQNADVPGVTMPKVMSDSIVKEFADTNVYVTAVAASRAVVVMKQFMSDLPTRRRFTLLLPAGLGREILKHDSPPPPPPKPLVYTHGDSAPVPPPTDQFLSTTMTGPQLTQINGLLESMPTRPIARAVAHAALRAQMHEFISADALRDDDDNHKRLAKKIAVCFWACVGFLQFQAIPVKKDTVGTEVPFMCLSFMRMLDEMARHALGDFRQSGSVFKHIKEAREEMGFNERGRGSLMDLMDKYVVQSKYMRKGAQLAKKAVEDSGNDTRQLPMWVDRAAKEEFFELPAGAQDQAARFTNAAKKPRDTFKDVLFVLDSLWEPF
jgi:hypothetical protein